jgi:cytochrome c biogenesis protein
MPDSDNSKPESPAPSPESGKEYGLFDLLWLAITDIPRLMRTLKFAVWLIIILALFTLAGAILPQEHLSTDPTEFAHQYVHMFHLNPDDGRTTFGEFLYYRIVVPLELYRVFDTGLYFALLALLAISSTLCAWDRWTISRKVLSKVNPVAGPAAIRNLKYSDQGTVSENPETAGDRAREILKKSGYHVFEASDENSRWLLFRKNSFRYFASVIFHFAFVIILIGALLSGDRVLGYEGMMRIAEGGDAPVGSDMHRMVEAQQQNTEFTPSSPNRVELIDYYNIYRERDFPGIDPESGFPIGFNGMPSDYVSHLRIVNEDTGEILADKSIEVNYPLRYNGIAYYQTAYDYTIHLAVEVHGMEPQAVSARLGEVFTIPIIEVQSVITQRDIVGGIWVDRNGNESELPYRVRLLDYNPVASGASRQPELLGYIAVDEPLTIGGATIVLEGVDEFTILQYSHDPGVPIVYLGGILLMVGLTLVLYLPWRTGRLMLTRENGKTKFYVGGNSEDIPGLLIREFGKGGK